VSSLENHIGTAVKSRKVEVPVVIALEGLLQQRLRQNENPQRLLWKCMRSHASEVTGERKAHYISHQFATESI